MKNRIIKILILSSLFLILAPSISTASIQVTAEILGQCGNNIKEIYEDCDGTDFGSSTCQSIGYSSGDLGCSDVCTYDTVQCINLVTETSAQGGVQSGGSVAVATDVKINFSNVTFSGSIEKNGILQITRNSELITKINVSGGNAFSYTDTSVKPGIYTYTLTHSLYNTPQSFIVQVDPYKNIQILGVEFKEIPKRDISVDKEGVYIPVAITPTVATGTVGIGQIVKLRVILPEQKEKIYGFSGTVKIPENVSFKTVEYVDNLEVQWVQKPIYTNGIITFQANIPDGYVGVINPNRYPVLDPANLFTIVLESNKSGVGEVVVESDLYPNLKTNVSQSGKSDYNLKVSTYRYEDPLKQQYATTTKEVEKPNNINTIISVSIIISIMFILLILRFAR